MPIMYVNPAPRRKRRVKPLRTASVGRTKTSRRVKRARKNAARRINKRKGKSMARKLYGAAAKAHAKRLSKTRRKRKRKNPAAKRRRHARTATRRRRRRNPAAAAAPATNPSRRRRRRRKNPSAYAMGHERTFGKPKRKRRRKARKSAAAPRRRRRSRKAASTKTTRRRAAARRRYRAKHPGAKRRTGVKALRRARRSIKRARRRGGRAGAYARRYHMRANPGLAGIPGTLMAAVKVAVPVAASLYLTRFIVAKIGPSIPGLNSMPAQLQGPALATGMVVLASFATKKGPLAKYRAGIMIGVSLNLVDTLVKAFAPDSVKTMFGLGDSGMYDQALGEYARIGDYLQVGAVEPIDDDIALSDYVEMSGIEEELGAIQEELGVEEELGNGGGSPFGDDGPNNLGGVGQSSMLKALKSASAVGVVPQRSFVKQIPSAGPGYDNPSALYTGNFSGGF